MAAAGLPGPSCRLPPHLNKKIFLLGVGAQKSGTTFLSVWLGGQPRADFGMLKEYHVLDALDLPEFNGWRDKALDHVRADLALASPELGPPREMIRFHMIASPRLYFAYFNDLLARGDKRLTGDITPTYAALSAERLAWVRDGFARRGVTVKPVFLMRDPVYRVQSMVRMGFRRAGASPDAAEELAAVRRMHLSEGDLVRASYHETLERLFEVFGQSGVFVKLYEDFFTPAIADELGAFLGMELTPPDLERKYNVSTTPNHLSREDYEEMRAGYRPVIEGVARLTGLDVDAKWRWKPPATA